MKHKKKIAFIAKTLLLIGVASSLTACSLFSRSEDSGKGLVIERDVNKLEEGAYYTFDGEKYQRLYIGDRTFVTTSGGNDKGNQNNVFWLKDDIDYIPIMHRGDKIVYRSKSNLVTELTMERFTDLGYSIGVAGLRVGDSGRYGIDIKEGNLNINPNSDAKELFTLSEKAYAVIDSIGDVPLRAGNISPYGTIVGLEKDKTYAVNAYIGTILHPLNMKADSHTFGSFEGNKIGNFKYSGDQTVEFEIPDYYNSGYYLVSGYGLVRYLATDNKEETEAPDMNVPNIYPKNGEEDKKHNGAAQQAITSEDVVSTKIKVEKDGEQIVAISYASSGVKKLPVPIAKLITPDGAFKFEKGEGDSVTLSTTLQKGEYEIQIIGLKGRTYSYRVSPANGNDEVNKKTPSSSTSDKKSMADLVNGQ